MSFFTKLLEQTFFSFFFLKTKTESCFIKLLEILLYQGESKALEMEMEPLPEVGLKYEYLEQS